jgi:hypothetical protein
MSMWRFQLDSAPYFQLRYSPQASHDIPPVQGCLPDFLLCHGYEAIKQFDVDEDSAGCENACGH